MGEIMLKTRGWLLLVTIALVGALALPASAQWYPQQDQGWHRDHDHDDQYRAGQYGYGQSGAYNNSDAYRQGYNDGMHDRNSGSQRVHRHAWKNDEDARAYSAGYNAAFNGGNGRWGNNGQYSHSGHWNHNNNAYGNSGRQAERIGYQDGVNDGQKDRSTGHSFRPTKGDNYKNADRGYSSSFGDKQSYKNSYREGYEQGYEQGYNGGGGRGWHR
jgi:hypothetical protein